MSGELRALTHRRWVLTPGADALLVTLAAHACRVILHGPGFRHVVPLAVETAG